MGAICLKMKPKVNESDIFFELFLPAICDKHARQLSTLKETIVFNQFGSKNRSWTLQGLEKPWVKRGKAPDADLEINLSEALIAKIVRGEKADLETSFNNQELGFRGNPQLLEKISFIFSEPLKASEIR